MKFFYFNLTFIIFFSCKKDNSDCIKSVGDITIIERELTSFENIILNDNIRIIIKSGSNYKAQLKGGKNLLRQIDTQVIDNNLYIHNKNKCNWVREDNAITIYIQAPLLTSIFQFGTDEILSDTILNFPKISLFQYGSGDIHLKLNVSELNVDLNGLGNVILHGDATKVNAHLYNPGKFHFGILKTSDLNCKQMTLISETQAHCFVKVDSLFEGIIKDDGNVYYTGKSITTFSRLGMGHFIETY